MKKWIDVFRMCVLIGAVAFYICVLCLIGDNVTTRYQEVNEALWSCPWLEFPHKIQKTFPLILSLTQKPIYMEGFMNVRCTREVMNAVILSIEFYMNGFCLLIERFSYFRLLADHSHIFLFFADSANKLMRFSKVYQIWYSYYQLLYSLQNVIYFNLMHFILKNNYILFALY